MKIKIDKSVVRGLLNYIKLELGIATMKERWMNIRKNWKANPLKVSNPKALLKQMQTKFAMLDDFATMIMVSAEKARTKIKEYADLDPDTVSGAVALEACAQFLDEVVKFPYTFTGRICEFFDRQIFYFLLQLVFYFRRKDIEGKK